MDTERLKSIVYGVVPSQVIAIFKAINSELDWAILAGLQCNTFNFTELNRFLGGVDNKILRYHLKKLMMKGLVLHYIHYSINTGQRGQNTHFQLNQAGEIANSYYTLTKLGKKLIRNINEVFAFE